MIAIRIGTLNALESEATILFLITLIILITEIIEVFFEYSM